MEDMKETSALVCWDFKESRLEPNIDSVTVVVQNMGNELGQIISKSVPWDVRSTRVEGLYPGMRYRVFLSAPDEDEESAEPASGKATLEFTLPCE